MKQRFLRMICTILCFGILLGCAPLVSAYTNVDKWAQEAITEMELLGLIPDCLMDSDLSQEINRAEMCKLVVRVYEELMADYVYYDSDHPAPVYFSDTTEAEISFAYERCIISGYADGTFRPAALVSRQDFFVFVHNMMVSALQWEDESIEMKELSDFSDAEQISGYATDAVRLMYSIGLVNGIGTEMQPKEKISRQQAIVLLDRVYNFINEWALQRELKYAVGNYQGISSWAYTEVSTMDRNGMFPKCLRDVNLKSAITREQMCSIAILAYNQFMGKPYQYSGENPFSDVADDNTDVLACAELKIVSGKGGGQFDPEGLLTREEFFTLMSNFMTVLGYTSPSAEEEETEKDGEPDDEEPTLLETLFEDASEISGWARSSIELLVGAELVKGSGSKLLPKDTTACQEALALFLRCYNFMQEHSIAKRLVEYALTFEGYRYIYGGTTPSGFDCSGFAMYVYKHFDYSITRTATSQYRKYKSTFVYKLGIDEIKPGDLVFFYYSSSYDSVEHVGIYIGDGKFIHAANSNQGVIISNLYTGSYYRSYYGAARVIN